MKPEEISFEISSEFRQVVLKEANTYTPKIKLDKLEFKDSSELFKLFAEKLCDDFSEQLYPKVLDMLHKELEKHL